MTTVIRVKRHLEDDPVEAVRLECKRRRTEEAGSSTSFEKVLNFIGTVEKKEDLVCQRTLGVPTAYLQRLKQLRSQRPDILSKLRVENKAKRDEGRFKVISCMRSTKGCDELHSSSEDKPQDLTILDVNIEKSGEDDGHRCTSEDGFVYDLYTAKFEEEDYKDVYLDNVVGIEPYTSEIVFDANYRDSEEQRDGSCDPDEDDSNDENNWRNFYPDEDGSDSEEIDVLTNNFRQFGTDDVYELSSDDGEEKYPNYEDKNDKRNYFYEEAEDLAGSSYAKYKMNVLKECFNDDDKDETN